MFYIFCKNNLIMMFLKKWYYVINFFFDGVSIYNGINLLFYFIFLYLVVYVIKIKYFLLILMIYMDDLIDIL